MLKNTMFKNITYDEIQTLIKAKAKCLPVRDYTHNEMERINYVMGMLVRSFIVYGPDGVRTDRPWEMQASSAED